MLAQLQRTKTYTQGSHGVPVGENLVRWRMTEEKTKGVEVNSASCCHRLAKFWANPLRTQKKKTAESMRKQNPKNRKKRRELLQSK
jgi:hypothetical protein